MTLTDSKTISDSLEALGRKTGKPVPVLLSHELVGLLSEQMYGSPLKAMEEMVVNSYDADARECRISVPSATRITPCIAVYDDGAGMNRDEIRALWNIGRSQKREEHIQTIRSRKQIGKFGIGKLATYAVATKITFFSKQKEQTLAVTTDFQKFGPSPAGQESRVVLPVYEVDDLSNTFSDPRLQHILDNLGLADTDLKSKPSWTLVILEELKESVNIHMGRLTWILQTAMPLKADFQVSLNGEKIESSKEQMAKAVEFPVSELPEQRLKGLREETSQDWKVKDQGLVSQDFPSGITGTVMVTEQIIRTGKSDDIMRSHGFFIKVRERLINERDARFGLHELSHEVFNRFRADIEIDDLDTAITAPREGVGDSNLRETAGKVLNEIFNEARSRYNALKDQPPPKRKEHETDYVPHTLLEYRLADVLSLTDIKDGAEPDKTWFYIDEIEPANLPETIQDLYSGERKSKYRYEYVGHGRNSRIVRFSPNSAQFTLNDDHEVVRAYKETGLADSLLEDIATAEALLEVYLREAGIPTTVIGEILEKRDSLLRSLAKDHLTSVASISQSLLDASNQSHELEVALVASARSIGFTAKHIGGPDAPDGIASYIGQPDGEKKITLEAKASNDYPSLGSIDIGTLAKHVKESGAEGCLLVAPRYPGESRGEEASISRMAKDNKISCWSVETLAKVVAATQSRHISAQDVLEVVLAKFAPEDVEKEVERLLTTPSWDEETLYDKILSILQELVERLSDSRPTVDMVIAQLTNDSTYSGIKKAEVRKAVSDIAGASKGTMTIRNNTIIILTSIDELRRRTSGITNNPGIPRRNGQFRLTREY